MFQKRAPFYVIYDHTFNQKKKRMNRLFRFAYLLTIIICLMFFKSLIIMALTIILLMLIKRIMVIPNYCNQIQLYPDSFSYMFKRNVCSFEYGSVAYIDQDVFELDHTVYYNKLSLLDEQMNTLLTIDGRNFNYDDLVDFCQYIQDTNVDSRLNYYNRNAQFLSSVTFMDE